MIPDLSRTERMHLSIQADNKPPVSLAPKRCACGKPAFAKQLVQFGKCVACALADRVVTLEPGDVEKLKHALGADSRYAKSKWGWRNYYLAGGLAHQAFDRLVAAGFASQGRRMGDETYFHATRAGAKLAGLNSAGIKRALGE